MKKLHELSNEELQMKMKQYRPIIIILVITMFASFITLLILRMNHLYSLFILIPFTPVYIRFNQLYKESRKRKN